MRNTKTLQRKFFFKEVSWREVKPGTKIGASYGIITVKSIEETPEGILIIPVEDQFPWIQHPSQTISVAFENTEYR